MAQKGQYGLYFNTAAGANNATLSTTACHFIGAVVIGSAGGCQLSVHDSDGGEALLVATASTHECIVVMPAWPIVCTAGLATTASGTGGYSIYWGR